MSALNPEASFILLITPRGIDRLSIASKIHLRILEARIVERRACNALSMTHCAENSGEDGRY